MQEIRLHRWNDFVELTDAQAGWAFRGEVSARWPLVSSLTRRLQTFCEDRTLWPLREERALRVFRRKAHIYLSDRSALQDDLRCLALMQHHGAPTRLLDFTKSPYVAAFFALEDAVDDAAVYALNTPALWSAAPAATPRSSTWSGRPSPVAVADLSAITRQGRQAASSTTSPCGTPLTLPSGAASRSITCRLSVAPCLLRSSRASDWDGGRTRPRWATARSSRPRHGTSAAIPTPRSSSVSA
jgi:hypothetical protein